MLCLAAALCSGCATVSHLDETEATGDPHKASMTELTPGTRQSCVESLSAVPPHPDSLPRGEISPSELAHCAPEPPGAQLSPSPLRSGGEGRGEEALREQGTSFDVRRSRVHGEGIPLENSWVIHGSVAQSNAGTALIWHWHVDSQSRSTAVDFIANTQLTLAPDSSADATAGTSPPELNPFSKAYVGLVWDNIKGTFTAPAHWDTCDWLVAGGLVAGIGTVAVFDEDIQRAVQRNRNSTLDDIFKNVQGFGNEYAPGVIGAFYLGGLVFHDDEAKAVALDAASASIIASGLILYPLKETVGRARP